MVRARENVSQREERVLTLENFRGVDFTSSPLRVDTRRAIFCRNLLPSGGRNIKRRGWRQEAHFTTYDLDGKKVALPIRGMWWYVWRTGVQEIRFLLVHAGQKLYGSKNGGAFELITEEMGGYGYSEAFQMNNRLYMIGNQRYLVFGSWNSGITFEARPVADDVDTYVPRTTMAINPTTDEQGTTIQDSRRSLDAVNLLCTKRKNSCMGRLAGGSDMIFYLDAAAQVGGEVLIEVELADENGSIYTETWKTVQNGTDGATIYDAKNIPAEGSNPAAYPSKGYFYYGNGDSPAHMVIHADCPPPLEGRDNITVTFAHAGSDQSWRIDMCKFGAMFGGGGNADRIVVAGLYGEEHIEYWSYWRDPTYFPDNGYNAVGSEGSAIVGFSRISDGVLACFKEEGRGEPVIYYHTAEDEPIYNDDGKLESMRFKLYTDAGNAGEGMISRMSSVDFYGDPLILSRNGVFGISYKQNVETADRYAAERSRNIRTNLCKRDLSNACGVVFEGKYWLAVDGVCYVADAGYTFRPSEGTSGYQYEWWLLDNIPATVMCVADGRLYFGTADGRLCYFLPESESDGSADAYRDLCWEVLTSDMITEQEDDFSELVVADDVYKTLRIGDRLVIQQSVWAVCLAAGDYELYDGKILPREGVAPMRQGDVLFISGDSSGAVRDGFYTVADVDDIGAFQLADTEGTVVTPAEAGFTVGISVTGKELYIVEMKADETDGVGGTVRVSLCEGGDPITFIEHELTGELDSWSGRIIHADTVVAEWYTPVLDLGTNTAMKTLTRLTVATEPGVSGRVTFGYETGYETRVASKMVASALGMGGLDLTSLDFHEFSLSSFASSWTQRVNERNINYIAFRWLSDDPSGSRVDSITARYKVTGNIRGGL